MLYRRGNQLRSDGISTSRLTESTLFFTLVLGGAMLVSGCEMLGENHRFCPGITPPAISVEVRNAVTNAPEAKNTRGRLIEGSYVDSITVDQSTKYQGESVPLVLEGAKGRPGTYTVLIEKKGFRSWSRSGVEVGKDECGVNTRRLEAELKPTDRSSEEISQQLLPRHNPRFSGRGAARLPTANNTY
jgi:hypothetical protein